MTRRLLLRRRLLWAGAVLGLLLLFATIEVLRLSVEAGDAVGRLASSLPRPRRRFAY